jgi:hypothetical protein
MLFVMGLDLQVNKAYLDLCKSTTMHSLAATEFSAICGVLADQVHLPKSAKFT